MEKIPKQEIPEEDRKDSVFTSLDLLDKEPDWLKAEHPVGFHNKSIAVNKALVSLLTRAFINGQSVKDAVRAGRRATLTAPCLIPGLPPARWRATTGGCDLNLLYVSKYMAPGVLLCGQPGERLPSILDRLAVGEGAGEQAKQGLIKRN